MHFCLAYDSSVAEANPKKHLWLPVDDNKNCGIRANHDKEWEKPCETKAKEEVEKFLRKKGTCVCTWYIWQYISVYFNTIPIQQK